MFEAAGKPDQAIAQAEAAERTGKENLRSAMMLAIGYQQKGDLAKARRSYEQVLTADPRNGAAANNLSLLLSDMNLELPRALQLAQIAQQAAPNDPRVADTYGWALYKNDRAEDALKILKDCAAKLPDSPAIQYHLGLTAQKVGDIALSRTALTKAINSPGPFPDRETAKQALSQLK
jgi:Tfp pilus assembly protein PilF